MIRRLSLLAVLAAAAIGLVAPSFDGQAATSAVSQQQWLCSPATAAGALPRTIGGTLSQVPSGTVYVTNSEGCALIATGDVAYLKSQGWYPGSNLFSIQYAGLTSAASATTVQIGVLPAGAVIQNVILAEVAGASITGGVDIGNAASGQQFVAAQALSANGLLVVADSALTRIVGSSGNTTQWPVYATCHTSCNAGSVTITILYSYM